MGVAPLRRVPWGWRWTLIILAAGLVDFWVRVATNFDMARVVRAEAILFFTTGLVLWVLKRRSPAQRRWQRGVQEAVVGVFALAGLRAALWAGGLPVARANLVIVIIGLVWGATALRRRYRASAAT